MKRIIKSQNKEYIARSYYYRGWVINEFAGLEKAIEQFLIDEMEISQDKVFEMQTTILDRMTFEAKRTSFKTLLEDKFNRAGFVKTNKKSYPIKPLITELTLLNDERNRFAHYPLNYYITPEQNVDTLAISLLLYRDSYKELDYSIEDIKNIIHRINDAIFEIEKYRNDIDLSEMPF